MGFSYKLQPFALPLPMIRASFGMAPRGVRTSPRESFGLPKCSQQHRANIRDAASRRAVFYSLRLISSLARARSMVPLRAGFSSAAILERAMFSKREILVFAVGIVLATVLTLLATLYAFKYYFVLRDPRDPLIKQGGFAIARSDQNTVSQRPAPPRTVSELF